MKTKKLVTTLFLFNTLLFGQEYFSQSEVFPKEQHSFGIEFNLVRPFLMKRIDINSFSGGLNYFDDTNSIEIAIPFTYNKMLFNRDWREDDYDDSSITVDLHVRKFLKDEARNFYVGGFGRYTYLEGKSQNKSPKIAKFHRLGLGTEIGVRTREKKSPFYSGMSFGVGVYLDNNENIFKHDNYIMNMDGRKYFWDIELFKFGYEF